MHKETVTSEFSSQEKLFTQFIEKLDRNAKIELLKQSNTRISILLDKMNLHEIIEPIDFYEGIGEANVRSFMLDKIK